jgi:hypothetical protein
MGSGSPVYLTGVRSSDDIHRGTVIKPYYALLLGSMAIWAGSCGYLKYARDAVKA